MIVTKSFQLSLAINSMVIADVFLVLLVNHVMAVHLTQYFTKIIMNSPDGLTSSTTHKVVSHAMIFQSAKTKAPP